MESKNVKADEIRGFDAGRMKEFELQARRQILDMRMDVYGAAQAKPSVKGTARRNLARLLTVKNEQKNSAANKRQNSAAKQTKK